MSDYKDAMQSIAEEIAEDEFGMDFYSLSDAQQHEVYSRAMGDWTERQVDAADYARKAEREK